MEAVFVAQVFSDLQLFDIRRSRIPHPCDGKLAVKFPLALDRAKHPVWVIQREPCDAKKQHCGQTEHGSVNVQPASKRGDSLFKAAIAVDCYGWTRLPAGWITHLAVAVMARYSNDAALISSLPSSFSLNVDPPTVTSFFMS